MKYKLENAIFDKSDAMTFAANWMSPHFTTAMLTEFKLVKPKTVRKKDLLTKYQQTEQKPKKTVDDDTEYEKCSFNIWSDGTYVPVDVGSRIKLFRFIEQLFYGKKDDKKPKNSKFLKLFEKRRPIPVVFFTNIFAELLKHSKAYAVKFAKSVSKFTADDKAFNLLVQKTVDEIKAEEKTKTKQTERSKNFKYSRAKSFLNRGVEAKDIDSLLDLSRPKVKVTIKTKPTTAEIEANIPKKKPRVIKAVKSPNTTVDWLTDDQRQEYEQLRQQAVDEYNKAKAKYERQKIDQQPVTEAEVTDETVERQFFNYTDIENDLDDVPVDDDVMNDVLTFGSRKKKKRSPNTEFKS